MKTCRKCKRALPITDFYVHPSMGDGRLNKCKECTKADVRRNYYANIEQFKEYERGRANLPHRVAARAAYAATEIGRANGSKAKRAYTERNPQKRLAVNAVNNALRDGRLIKGPCEDCGTTVGVQGHHDDYSKQLDVHWLCPKHHAARHKQLRAA